MIGSNLVGPGPCTVSIFSLLMKRSLVQSSRSATESEELKTPFHSTEPASAEVGKRRETNDFILRKGNVGRKESRKNDSMTGTVGQKSYGGLQRLNRGRRR